MNQSSHKNLKRSRRVKALRRFLPILVTIFIAVFVAYTVFDRYFDKDMSEVAQKIEQKRRFENTVDNPTIHTTDQKGVPVDISADLAHQKEEGVVDFENPKAVLHGAQNRTLKVRSKTGHYERDQHKVDFEKDVHAILGDDHQLRTQRAQVDLEKDTLSSKEIVEVNGSLGDIVSQEGMIYGKNSDELLMNGHTVMDLQMASGNKGGVPVRVISPQGVRCYLDQNKCITQGKKAQAKREDLDLKAGVFVAFFEDIKTQQEVAQPPVVDPEDLEGGADKGQSQSTRKELKILEAIGNVHFLRASTNLQGFGGYGVYDAKALTLTLDQNPKLKDPKNDIFGDGRFIYFEAENKIKAFGRTTLRNGKNLIQGDQAIIYLRKKNADKSSPTSGSELSGSEIDRVELTGNVTLSTPKDYITSDRGTYFGQTELVELYGSVKLSNDRGLLQGNFGRYDLQTGRSEVFNKPKANGTSGQKNDQSPKNSPQTLEPLKPAQGVQGTQQRVQTILTPKGNRRMHLGKQGEDQTSQDSNSQKVWKED